MRDHVIYIPGLGDVYDPGRRFALKIWLFYGVHAELVSMDWDGEKQYQPKYDRVVRAIESAKKCSKTVSIVADSAGASLALNVLADHPELNRVVLVCGVNSPDIEISEKIRQRDPALVESVKRLKDSLPRVDKSKIFNLVSHRDFVVEKKYSDIEGVRTHKVPFVGHIPTVSFCLTFYAWRICRAVKRG